MPPDLSLHHRRRPPTAEELAAIPWLRVLDDAHRAMAEAEIKVGDALPGDLVCRTGRPVTYWFGVVDGLLKMSGDSADGRSMTFTGVPPGGWFGEGTALKREPYRYNIQALRRSIVAGLPVDSFHWLLDHSIGFNRFVMNQINERLGQFIAALETDRLNNPDARVARSLSALFNPVLYPGVGDLLRITQQELAYLVGLSRQRVNESLRILQAQGAIRVEYGGVRVLDLAALRASGAAMARTGGGDDLRTGRTAAAPSAAASPALPVPGGAAVATAAASASEAARARPGAAARRAAYPRPAGKAAPSHPARNR